MKVKCWCELEDVIVVDDWLSDEEISEQSYDHLSDQFDWGFEVVEDDEDDEDD